MKKAIILICFTVLMTTSAAWAKFNPPEGYLNRATKRAMAEFVRLDTDKDGRLSPDEYKGKVGKKLTRDEEKASRRARKKGTYQTAEQQFNTMDKEEKGFITLDQFIKFYNDMENSDGGKGKYY